MKNLILILALVALESVLLAEGQGWHTAQEIQLDQTISGNLASAYHDDFYKFNLDRTGTLRVKMLDLPSNAVTCVDISSDSANGDSLPVYECSSTPGELLTVTVTITKPDTHYLMIRNMIEGELSDTEYSFVVTLS